MHGPRLRRRVTVVIIGLALLTGAAWWGAWRHGHAGARQAGARARASWQRRGGRPADVLAGQRARIAGRVTDPERRPVAGATVCAQAESEHLSTAELREPSCVLARPNGQYEIAGLVPAQYGVGAAAAHYRPASYREGERAPIELAAGETRSGIDLVLEPGAVELRGRVKDIGGGVVAGALVHANDQSGWWTGRLGTFTHSNEQGEFALWVRAGQVSVSAHAAGYAQGFRRGVAPGQFLEILLTPESVLVGRVVEAGTQAPVAGALVTAGGGWGDGTLGDWGATAFSDGTGRFRIERLEPGRYKPVAEAPGRYGRAVESVLLGLGQTSSEVVIEMHPAVSLAGRVLIAPRDQPCPDGVLLLHGQKRNREREARTDRSGAVFVRALLPGTYKVRVVCRGYLSEDEYPKVVVADRDLEGLTWRVRSGQSIRGVVVTRDGAPVAQAEVMSQAKGVAPRAQQTGASDSTRADGSFALDGLLPGTYTIEVTPHNLPAPKQPVEVVLEPGKSVEGLRIVVDGGGSIEGLVADPDGAPVGGVHVAASGGRWSIFGDTATTTRDDGGFRIEGLAPGEYRVVARRGFWQDELRAPGTGDDDVQGVRTSVTAGQVSRVRLTVERQTGEIRGQVLDEHRRPVPDAFVDAERESESATAAPGSARRAMRWGWERAPVLTDVDGRFKVSKLSPGAYTVRAFRRGGGEAMAEHVRVGTTVTLTIPATGSIAGTVATGEGKPPEAFTIELSDAQSGLQRRESFYRTGGRWALRDLAEGNFRIATEAPEGVAATTVPLDRGQNVENIRLVLAGRATVRGRLVALDGGKPVPNMQVSIVPARPGAGYIFNGDGGDRKRISDEEGRFEVENAPSGRVQVNVMPVNFLSAEGEYGFARVPAHVQPGQFNELPPIRLAKQRVKEMHPGGDLGYETKDQPPDVEPDAMRWIVAHIRPDGPAAKSGLQVGDVIVAVDGHDVTGANAYLYWSLTSVPEGTSVTLGLERGAGVRITASKPL